MPQALPDLTFDAPSADSLAGDGEFWQLYDSSFPTSEREPRSVILETIRHGAGLTVRARASERTVGFAITHLLRQPPALFLIYLAVVPELRSRHLGTSLFENVWTQGLQKYKELRLPPAGMVWEVDIPELAASEEDQKQSHRRLAFFARLGGHILPMPYFQPPVDGVTAVAMHVMFRRAPDEPLPDDSERSALVRALYFEKYQQANGIPRPVLEDLLRKASGAQISKSGRSG
jgi:hypothetical protein